MSPLLPFRDAYGGLSLLSNKVLDHYLDLNRHTFLNRLTHRRIHLPCRILYDLQGFMDKGNKLDHRNQCCICCRSPQ